MAVLQLIRGGGLIEEYGQFVSGARNYFVKLLGQASVQDAIFNALSTSGIPQPGEAWSSQLPRLCVQRRTPEVRVWKAGLAKLFVRIEYALEPPDKGYPLRGGGSIVQVQANKDRSGFDMTVTYGTKTIKKPIGVFGSEAVEIRETIELTDHPGDIRKGWLNHVNADTWMGENSAYWMVSRIEYELVNAVARPNRYRFTWEFSKSALPSGWQPTVIYTKPNGEIPNDAFWETKLYYPTKSFSEKFPWSGEVLRG